MVRDHGKEGKRDKGKGIATSSQDQLVTADQKFGNPNRKPLQATLERRHTIPAEALAEKEAEVERMIEEGLRSDAEEEVESPKERKRLRRTGPLPCFTTLAKRMRLIKWAPMRFPHRESLQQLGILEDVTILLRNMGMESFLDMAYPVHKEVSCQFLASFEVVHHYERDEVDGYGYITFKIRGKAHKVGFARLSSIFGLCDDRDSFLSSSSDIATDVWGLIAREERYAGSDKCNEITNPGVRYAAKVLSHTFYARREPCAVNEDELKFLGLGLIPLVGEDDLTNTLQRDYQGLGLIGVLMRRFDYYKHWAWTTSDKTPKLFIGSLITPILAALRIDLGPLTEEPAHIDIPYLKKTSFLAGKKEDGFAYDFYSGYDPTESSYFLLPNEEMTTVLTYSNIQFDPEPRLHTHPPFTSVTAPRKRKSRAGSSQAARHSDADDEATPAPRYGTQRYHFQPYEGTTTSLALRESLAQNVKLQKWNKMQDWTISKLTNSVKILKRQMKKVTALLAKATIGSGCQVDDVMGEAGSSALPRPSYYEQRGAPHEPSRSSDYELRRRRRNPSPPARESSNESPSVATADDWDTEGTSFYP
ncbi:hypothetical protein Bca101_057540 [Brassica carinata]